MDTSNLLFLWEMMTKRWWFLGRSVKFGERQSWILTHVAKSLTGNPQVHVRSSEVYSPVNFSRERLSEGFF